MNTVTEKKNYYDSWTQDPADLVRRRVDRAHEAEEHLLMMGVSAGEHSRILEIGPGLGGVTQAIKELFKGCELATVDRDARSDNPELRLASDHHYRADLLELSHQELTQLLQDAELVIALRTSGELADYLLTELPTFFSGMLIFSLVLESESRAALTAVESQVHQAPDHQVRVLHNDRYFTEKGYTISYAHSQIADHHW